MHLTFDDGPHPEWTPRVLDQLAQDGHKGHVFLWARTSERYPDVFDRIRREKGIAGATTPCATSRVGPPLLSPICESYLECEPMTASGLFRPPYGRILDAGRAIGAGSEIVMWDVLTGDFDRRRSAQRMPWATERALRPGSIVVMHDSDKAGPRLGLLPGLLDHYPRTGLEGRRPPCAGTPH